MSQTPPQTLGKYQVIREIARSNDIVYEAYDPQMNRRVALKELAMPPGATEPQREERLRRFLREAKAAGSLAHPNIVTVYDVDQDGDRTFLAMEFLTGHTLRNALDTKGQIEPKRAVETAIEVLAGLEFAHTNGVVHRDIKPENIQVLDCGRIKITDFGIARLTFEPNLTMDGQVFGTPSYMSPEQIHGNDIDARSDIFSLGVVLYEMVAGTKPFVGDNVVAISHAILHHRPPQPQAAVYPLWQAIERAIEKTPSQRFASAAEMAAALRGVLDQMVAGTAVAAPVTAPGGGYGQPYQPPQGTPPPYIPPGQAGPTAGPQGPPPMGAPYQQAPPPILYHPHYYRPPKVPILQPETKVLMLRVLTAAVMVAAVLGLAAALVVALVQMVDQAQRTPGQASVAAPAGPAAAPPPAVPKARASALELTGQAARAGDASDRQRLWTLAADAWVREVEASPDLERAVAQAVEAYLSAALEAARSGRRQPAREALHEAESFASGRPGLREAVDAVRAELAWNGQI